MCARAAHALLQRLHFECDAYAIFLWYAALPRPDARASRVAPGGRCVQKFCYKSRIRKVSPWCVCEYGVEGVPTVCIYSLVAALDDGLDAGDVTEAYQARKQALAVWAW